MRTLWGWEQAQKRHQLFCDQWLLILPLDTAAVSPASHTLGSVPGQPSLFLGTESCYPAALSIPGRALRGRPPESIGPTKAEQSGQKPFSPFPH